MRLHSSALSTGADRPALLRWTGTPVLVGVALAALLVGFAALAWANSRSSSSCDVGGAACDTAAVATETAATQAVTAGETTSHESDHDMTNHDMTDHNMEGHAMADQVVVVAEPVSTDSVSVTTAPGDAAAVESEPADSDPASASPTPTDSDSDAAPASSVPATSTPDTSVPAESSAPETSAPATSAPATSSPGTSAPSDPTPTSPNPVTADYSDITAFGVFHGTSSHTHGDSLAGGRTAITTEALVVYNDLRAFHGLAEVQPEAIGRWAFANNLTNNSEAYGEELTGVGVYYGMQGAKVGWIRDDAFDPQILADIQRSAREGGTGEVMTMVEAYGHPGYADHLTRSGLVDAFVNTLKMEPHYGGWMHGRVHGGLPFTDGTGKSVATAHDINHLTVLSHDQQQAFMNDTFDWPQWPALDVPESVVVDYFQSMVVLGDPHSDSL